MKKLGKFEIALLIVYVLYYLIVFWGTEDGGPLKAGPIVLGICTALLFFGLFKINQWVIELAIQKMNVKVFMLLFIFVIEYYICTGGYRGIMLLTIQYFSFGKSQAFYNQLVIDRYGVLNPSLKTFLMKLKEVTIQRVSMYFFQVWLPFCVYILIQQFKKQERLFKLTLENEKNEIKLLKTKMNEGFVDSTLQNIYDLFGVDDTKAQTLLLKFSNATRYTLYETEEAFVPLNKELDFLINYTDIKEIQLEKRFVPEFKLKSNSSDTLMIAPMLLVQFFETAFLAAREFLRAEVEIVANQLNLQIEIDGSMSFGQDEIQKVLKRLNVVYNNRHEVLLEAQKISLKINLNHEANQLPNS